MIPGDPECRDERAQLPKDKREETRSLRQEQNKTKRQRSRLLGLGSCGVEVTNSGGAVQGRAQERLAEAVHDLRHLRDRHAMSRGGVARALLVTGVADCVAMLRVCYP